MTSRKVIKDLFDACKCGDGNGNAFTFTLYIPSITWRRVKTAGALSGTHV